MLVALGLQAQELVYQDKEGNIRWTKDNSRVALYGANYCLPSACCLLYTSDAADEL